MPNRTLSMITPVNWFHPLNQDLLGKWKVLLGIRGRTMPDITQKSGDGVLGTTASYTGITGTGTGMFGAIDMDTGNGTGIVTVPNSPSWNRNTPGWTLNLWVKVKLIANFDVVWGVGTWNSTDVLYQNSNAWTVQVPTTGTFALALTSSAIGYLTTVDNTFHMVTAVFDAPKGEGYLYSDGVKVGTDVFVDGTTNHKDADFAIGGNTNTNGAACEVSELSMWQRALEEDDIHQLFIEGKKLQSDLLNWIQTPFAGFVAAAGGQVGSIFRSPVIRAA